MHRVVRDRCSVVDATTGKRLGAYEADKEAAGTMACNAPDPDRFYIFTENQNGLDIVEAEDPPNVCEATRREYQGPD